LRHNNQTIRKKLIVKQNIYTCTMYIYWYSSTVSMSYNLLLTNPIPIESLSWASSPIPDATMMAQSGTAPRIGKTTPPN